MSEKMMVRVVPSNHNPERPFLLEMRGADGVWSPFGNHVTEEDARNAGDECIELWGSSLGLTWA